MEQNKRILYFIFACLLVRSLFVVSSYLILKNNHTKLRLIFSFFALSIGLSFLNQYRMKEKIGNFGGPAYWHPFRLVHGIIYIIFGILAFCNIKKAYLLLLLDVIIGILVFSNNYLPKIFYH